MSATLASSDVLQALCCECGAVRTVSRRYRRFTLRCEACGRQTKHAAIGFDDRGYWEEENRRAKLNLSVDDKLDLLRSLGVAVEERATRDVAGRPFHVSMIWDPEMGTFSVCVDRDRPERFLHEGLDAALEHVKDPGAHMWFVWVNEVNTVCEIGWIETERGERTRS